MLIHPNFDPVAIHLGPLAVRWYGLMYLVAFVSAIVIGRLRLRLPYVAAQGWNAKDIDDMLFYGVLGTILGGRLGYVIFTRRAFTRRIRSISSRSGKAACRFTAAFSA